MLVKLSSLPPIILFDKIGYFFFYKIKLYDSNFFQQTVLKKYVQNSFKFVNWLFPGRHLEVCNLPQASLESVTDFVRINPSLILILAWLDVL